MSEGNGLSVQYRLDAEDLFRSKMLHHRFAWRIAWIVVVMLAVVLRRLFSVSNGQAAARQSATLGLGLAWLFLMVGVVAALGWLYFRWEAGQTYRENLGQLGRDRRITISPEGVSHGTGEGEGRRPWSEVKRIRETRHHIYLYLGPTEAHTVPRRAFASPQEAERFLQAARAWHAAANR